MSGLSAAQAALSTTSNNISNYTVAGYSRQTTVLAQANSTLQGNSYYGNGVNITGVQREYDAFIATQLRGSSANYSAVSTQHSQISNIDDLLSTSTTSLSTSLQGFFTNLQNVLQHPFHHAQAGTQNRDHRDFFAFDLVDLYRAIPALNGDALCFQIGGRFVGQQAAHFRGQLAKTLCADIMLTHQAQFMFDQRVSDFHDLHWCSPGMS